MKFYGVTIQMKTTEQYFPEVLFIMLYEVVLTFKSVGEILWCFHLNETFLAQLKHSTLYFFGFYQNGFYLFCDFFLVTIRIERVRADRCLQYIKKCPSCVSFHMKQTCHKSTAWAPKARGTFVNRAKASNEGPRRATFHQTSRNQWKRALRKSTPEAAI